MRLPLVEIGAQSRPFVGGGQGCRGDDLVVLFGKAQIGEIWNFGRQAIGTHGQHALVTFAAHFGFAVGFHFLRVGVGVPVVGLLPVHLGARVDLGFAAAAVLAVLLVGRFFGDRKSVV